MPKAKNQSRRVYSLFLGVSAVVFYFFFLKKEELGDFRCFWFFFETSEVHQSWTGGLPA
ncbi:hypothetical protein HY491_02840 [Candidatus Woesearchaeota archaeon]|nr:hypothetical protein [Candidatus Woesearchaeota archaeon]